MCACVCVWYWSGVDFSELIAMHLLLHVLPIAVVSGRKKSGSSTREC